MRTPTFATDPRRFFEAYALDRRREIIAGCDRVDLGDLVRYTARTRGDEGMVAFATLSDEEADVRIAEQVEHFRALGQAFEWKVHAFPLSRAARRACRGSHRARPRSAVCRCNVDSRPILEGLGFVPMCATVPMRMGFEPGFNPR